MLSETLYLQIIQNREEWLINHVGVLPIRRITTSQRKGSTRTLWSSIKGNAKFCTWRGKSHAPVQIRGWPVGNSLGVHEPAMASLQQRNNSLLGCPGSGVASRPREVIFPLYWALVRHFWVPGSSSEPPSARESYFSYHLFLVLEQQRSLLLK